MASPKAADPVVVEKEKEVSPGTFSKQQPNKKKNKKKTGQKVAAVLAIKKKPRKNHRIKAYFNKDVSKAKQKRNLFKMTAMLLELTRESMSRLGTMKKFAFKALLLLHTGSTALPQPATLPECNSVIDHFLTIAMANSPALEQGSREVLQFIEELRE